MSNLFLLNNTEIIDLFEIKLNDFEGYLYFHGSKNFEKNLVFQGKTYLYIPCEMSNLQYDSEGKQNRPTFTISNVNNFISNIIKDRKDLLGKDFYRKKLLAKDLDSVNFEGESKNPLGVSGFSEFISSDKFIINKKNLENKERVEFELSNVLDIDGLTCPSRKVYNNSCPWLYRGYGCNYGKNLSYSGPYINITEPSNKTLLEAIEAYDNINQYDQNKGYLGGWFDYSGIEESQKFSRYKKVLGGNEVVYKDFRTATSNNNNFWQNKAGDINNNPSDSDVGENISINISWNGEVGPAIFYNIGRLNDNYGIAPVLPDNPNSRNYLIPISFHIPLKLEYDYNEKDITVFYVSEPTSAFWARKRPSSEAPYNGFFYRGLETEDHNTFIGFSGQQEGRIQDSNSRIDSLRIKNSSNQRVSNVHPLASNSNKPIIYSCCIPALERENNKIKFFKNGGMIFSTPPNYNGGSHGINNLGFNFDGAYASHIVIYEIIIFQKLLSDEAIGYINSYLGSKYGITTKYSEINSLSQKSSSDFFIGYDDGNLGVPIADENDKLFFKKRSNEFPYYDSYGLENLVYKGDYNNKTSYSKGNFVKIDPDINFDFTKDSLTQNSELPSRFFVCISDNGSKGINPLDNTEIWIEDKCSKKLSGCVTRFRTSQSEQSQKIPFGGFPGTVSYDYDLPK